MTDGFTWSAAQDARLRRLRAEGATWNGIAADLGVTRWVAIERGRRIGAPQPAPDRQARPAATSDEREPLPPGNPRSWRAITDRTLLHGSPYPLPVFERSSR